MPPNAVLLDQTTGLQGLLTILRDRETQREDFVHYCDRLATMYVPFPVPSPSCYTTTDVLDLGCLWLDRVVEKALGELPYKDTTVRTPIELDAKGKTLDVAEVSSSTSTYLTHRSLTLGLPLLCAFCRSLESRSPVQEGLLRRVSVGSCTTLGSGQC